MTNSDLSDTSTDLSVTPSESLVLYVDPDREMATSIVSALEDRSDTVAVSTVTTTADALSLLDQHPVECIISEHTLPDGDGLDLFTSVRTQYGDLPFILFTAAGSETLASDALSAGVTEYFSKQRGDAMDRLTRTVETVLAERHATRRLTEVEADEFQTLVDDIRDQAIFLLDPEGYISSWNTGAEQLKGYQQEEILGKHFSTFYPAEATERGKPSDMLAEARARGRTTDEGWRVRKDGTRFWADVVVSALRDDDGAIRGYAKFTRDLTDQHERERQVREQHELTERILDAVPVGVAVHIPNGDLVRANSRAQEILEIVGTDKLEEDEVSAIDTIYDADGQPMDEADMPPIRVFETERPVTDEEIVIEGSDGVRRWFSVNAVPMFDQHGEDIQRIITTGKEITALKEREAELEEIQGELRATVAQLREANHELQMTQNRFEALTENSSVAVLSIDGTSTIQFANDTIADVFGHDPEDLVGESLTTVIPDRFVDSHLSGINRYIESGERRLDWEWIEVSGLHKDGHEIDLGLSFGETVVDGDHLFTAVIRDITDQKERKRELDRRREELNELVDELERSNAELEQFAYAVSHDLKEPLRMVRSYLDLLERRYGEQLGDDAEEFIEFAVSGATRMQRMIEDILEFSRVGRNDSSHEPVDCTAVLEEIRDMLPIEERCEVTVEPLPTVWGNRTQLTKVFQNLLSNAIAHSEGDVTVHISAERQGDEWCFSVADDGPGILPAQQEHVFELFNTAGRTGGTGVGLAICRKVVEYHGGTIHVDSTPGEGTTFSFTLPDAETADAVAE